MDICEQLKDLGEIFLARPQKDPSPKVEVDLRLRRGRPTAHTERIEGRKIEDRIFRHHLTVDPVRVEAAWNLLGTHTLSGAIVLDAKLVSRVLSIAVIYSWTGVEQRTPVFRNYGHRVPKPMVEIVKGFVAVIPGANVPDVRLCANSEKLAVRYARSYLERFPETDWGAIDAWSDSLGRRPLTDVTDISMKQDGDIVVHGRRSVRRGWRGHGPDYVASPDAPRHRMAEDGRWVVVEHVVDLERYYRWRNEQRAASAPPPIPDEDLEAFVL